jgi:hypothetical protein
MQKPNETGARRRTNMAERFPGLFRSLSTPVLTSAALLAVLPLTTRGEDCCQSDGSADSLSFSARFGFNMPTRFKGGALPFVAPQLTPNGLAYNYDDGYVLRDASGNKGGYTVNWGFNNASQVTSPGTPNNSVAMHRTVSVDPMASFWKDSDVSTGGELLYRHEIGCIAKPVRWGFEAAVNFMDNSVNDGSTFTGNVTRQTDIFNPFPGATITGPRQQTFTGPGTVLNATPSASFPLSPASMSGNRRIDADIWGFRLGPYVEYAVTKKFDLSLSAGLAVALVDAEASWADTLTIVGGGSHPIVGSGDDHAWRFGAYVAGTAEYKFAKDWSLMGGVQFQDVANYDHNISGRGVEIDLSKSIFVTLGLGYRF